MVVFVSEKKIIVTTRSHGSPLINESLENMKSMNLMTELIRVGGAGFKVLCAIEKGAHAYVFSSPGTKKWDTCAPEAVLLELSECPCFTLDRIRNVTGSRLEKCFPHGITQMTPKIPPRFHTF